MNTELFQHMPRVQSEVLDRRLRLDPVFVGKHIVALGCLDVDGYGYLAPVDSDPLFVTPGSVLKFNEPRRVTDLAQQFRLFATNSNVGETDEIAPAIAELQEQGASNISFMRLDMAFVAKSDEIMRPVLQSTGQLPDEWRVALGIVSDGSGGWTYESTNRTWIPSVAYRTFAADVYTVSNMDVSTVQQHLDPTDADFRYHALGRALNNLIGEDVDVVVFAAPPGWINPARCQDALGIYPLRPTTVIAGSEADIIELGAPTINNPNLNKVILHSDVALANYLDFKSLDVVGYDTASITVTDKSLATAGDAIVINVGTSAVRIYGVSGAPTASAGQFQIDASTNALVAASIAAAIAAASGVGLSGTLPVTATVSSNVVTLTSRTAGEAGRIGVIKVDHGATGAFTVTTSKASGYAKISTLAGIDPGSPYQATVTFDNTNMDDGDAITLDVGGNAVQFTAKTTAASAVQFTIGSTSADTAENFRLAVLGQAALMTGIGSLGIASDVVTIVARNVNVGDSLTKVDADDGMTIAETAADPGDQVRVISGGVTTTIEAAGAQDSAAGEFRYEVLSAVTTATNMAAAFTGKTGSNLTAFGFNDGTSSFCVIFAETAATVSTSYDFTLSEPVEASAGAITIVYPTSGASVQNGRAYASLPALAGSSSDAADRNFAHLLAVFCFWQSYYERSCKGFIGAEIIDTDLDGVISAEDLKNGVGQERSNVEQYIDNENDEAYAANGTGLLGFEDFGGYDGIHRTHANVDFPVNFKFFATTLSIEFVQRNKLQSTIMLSSSYGDALVKDSDKGEYLDMGARIRVCANDVYAINAVSQRYNEAVGAYLTNAAISMAGLESLRPQGRSLTKLRLNNCAPLRRMSQSQMDNLLKCRIIPIQKIPESNKGEIQADDTGAFNIDIYHRSDFVMGLSLDVLDACVEDIRTITKPMLGRGLSPQLVQHMSNEVNAALKQRIRVGHIQEFKFQFLSTPVMQILGECEFFLEIVPAFEIRKVRIKAGLTMPSAPLVASGTGTFASVA